MRFNISPKNYKNIFISSFGAFLCMLLISFLNSIDASNILLIPPFGASLVLVMAVHESKLAQPKNIFFGHIFSAASGVFIFNLIGDSSFAIAFSLFLAIFIMMITNTVHPPAGANPIIAILGAKSFEFVIMPVAAGATLIIIFAVIYNKVWKR